MGWLLLHKNPDSHSPQRQALCSLAQTIKQEAPGQADTCLCRQGIAQAGFAGPANMLQALLCLPNSRKRCSRLCAPAAGVALGYNQLTNQDILNLPVPQLQHHGYLFVWVINASFRFALQLFAQWGYT